MSMGEQPKKLKDLDPADIERIGDEAVARMKQRVESRLALDIPQEPTLPMSVAGEDVHARTGSPQVPELSEPVSQDALPVDGPDEEATGQKWWLKEIAAEGQLTPDPKVEPVAAVAADNPDEAAEIERLMKEAAAVEATIAQESLGEPNARMADGRRRKLKPNAGKTRPQPEPAAEPAVSVQAEAEAAQSSQKPEIAPPTPEAVLVPVPDPVVPDMPVTPAAPEKEAPAPAAEAKKATADTSGEQYEFQVLKNGEEQQYLAHDDTLFIVRKKKDGYYFVDGDGELSGPVTQDVMRHQAEAERWRMIEAASAVSEEEPEAAPVAVEAAPVAEAAPANPEAPVSPEVPKVETPADSSQQKIDALRTDMEEFRYKYAEMDYEKNSAWKTLTGFFRNLRDNGQKDPDTEYWKSEYMSKLMELQNLELEQIKQEGLKGDELKERMAGMLRYYKIEQAAELYRDRTQVQIDKKGFVKKAWGTWEHIVKEYGKLSTPAKVFAGVALAGLSLSSGGAAALYIVAIRRAMGATGVAMTADALLAARAERKDKEKTEAHLAQFKEGFEVKDAEVAVEKFASLLKGEIEQLNNGLQKKKLETLRRKGLSLGIGVGLVFGGSALASQVSGMMHHEGAVAHTEPAAAPEAASSAPAAASAPEAASSAPARAEVPSASPGVLPQEFKVSFDRYQVTADDGKRGLWGVLEEHLPKDMLPQAEKNRIIQSLENVIQQKLDHMSAAELKEVGFPKGNINQIYAGTEIDLGKLLTPEEVQKVLEGQSVAASSLAEGAERVVSGAVRAHGVSAGLPEPVLSTAEVKDQAGFEKLVQQASAPKSAPVFDTSHTEALIQKNISFTDPKAYLAEHQGDQVVLGRYHSTLGRLRMGIFMMNPGEGGVPIEYDYTLNGEKLGGTKISQVLRDMKGFDKGIFQNLDYDRVKNPLHYDQMKDLAKFLDATKQAFGPDMSQVEAGESIDQYTRRMATAALRTGKEIKGFYKP